MSTVVREESSRVDSVLMLACLAIGLGFRLVVILSLPEQLTLDRDAYLGIAKCLASGQGYSIPDTSIPTAFRPPLYPLLLAIGLWAGSAAIVVGALNLLAGGLTVWLTALLGMKLGLGRVRFGAALLVAIDPLLLRYSSQPMTESLCTLLSVLWLWSVCVHWQEERTRSFSGTVAGICFGLLVLSRPTFWPLAGLCGTHWFVQSRLQIGASLVTRRSDYRNLLTCAAAACVIVAPWVIRNWMVMGTPILTTTHGGYTLLLGNNPEFYEQVVHRPWGATWPNASQHQWESDLESEMLRELGPQSTEMQRDAWQSRRAKEYMAAQPWDCLDATVHRIRSLWNTKPHGDQIDAARGRVAVVVSWYYRAVLFAALLGSVKVLLRPHRDRWWPLFALIICIQLVHLAYWTNTRMRAPLTPAIALFVAALLVGRRGQPRPNVID